MMRPTKKKVLHFVSGGKIGGKEKAIYQLVAAFQGNDEFEFGVTVIETGGYYVGKIRELGIPIINLNLKSGFSLKFSRTVLRQLRAYDIHHIHTASPNEILYSVLAGKGIRRVFTRRGGILPLSQLSTKEKLRVWISSVLLRVFSDGYSGNTINATNSVRCQFNIRNKPVFVLYNGFDPSLMIPDLSVKEAREALGINESDFVIGTACKLIDLKRVDLLIRAFGNCRIERKKLLIFGDGPERQNLVRLVELLNLGSAVRFTGLVSNMKDYYQALDCFVLGSTNAESFGNALVEAMHAKVPSVIMADSDGLREHIQHLETGYVAEGEEDLTHQIELIYQNPEVAKAIAQRASEYIESKYSLEHMKSNYKAFYRFACGEQQLEEFQDPDRIL